MSSKLKLVVIGVAVIFGLVAMIVMGSQVAPMFTMLLVLIVMSAVIFMATEDGMTHLAIEYENRFWSFLALVLACVLLLCPDSPFGVEDYRIAAPIIFFFTYFAHLGDRYLRAGVLKRLPSMKRIKSAEFGCLQERAAAHEKVMEVDKILNKIDHSLISSTFMNLFATAWVLKCERDIINIFLEANKQELNFMMQAIALARVMYKIKDHKLLRSYNRTKLLDLLAVKRIRDLSNTSKACLLHGFQNMKLSAHPLAEQYVRSIVKSVTQDELTSLKCLTDSKCDVNSMHKLIYTDIRDKQIQSEILKFIREQANVQLAHASLGTRTGKAFKQKRPWRKILSDIDDTMQCSGGSWPAGMHAAYPKHAIYPGVLAFYRELDLGIAGPEEWNDSLQGNLVFLSARPHVYKAVSEDETYKKFRYLKKCRGLYTSPTLLAGSIDSGTKFMFGGNPEPVAEKKFLKFIEFIDLYPEFNYIFVGDNGQGDARTVEMLMEKDGYKNYLTRAYIHEVQPVRNTYALKASTRSSYCSHITYFRNYVDAAIDAYHRKYIRLTGLRRIMVEAVADFHLIDWSGEHHNHAPTPSAVSGSDKGANALHAPSSASSSTSSASTGLATPLYPTKAATPASKVVSAAITKAQREMDLKRDAQMRELNIHLRRGNKVLAANGLAEVPLLEFRPQHIPGDVVSTPYGNGIVQRFRPLDGMYELLLLWDNAGMSKPIPATIRCSDVKPLPSPLPIPTKVLSSGSSLFRSRPTPAVIAYDVSSLDHHLKSISFRPPPALRKPESKPKSAVTPAPAVTDYDVTALARMTYREQLAALRVLFQQSNTVANGLITLLPKPADWEAFRMQFHTQIVRSQGSWTKILHLFLQPPAPNSASTTASSSNNSSKKSIAGTCSDVAIEALVAKSQHQVMGLLGCLVWTGVGVGWVIGFRESDATVLVVVDMGRNISKRAYPISPPSPLSATSCLGLVSDLIDANKYGTNDPSAAGGSGSFATCYLHRDSIVVLTDPLVTSPYQAALAKFYVESKLAAALMRLEGTRQEQERNTMRAFDKPPSSMKSPSRLTYAMRALGIFKQPPSANAVVVSSSSSSSSSGAAGSGALRTSPAPMAAPSTTPPLSVAVATPQLGSISEAVASPFAFPLTESESNETSVAAAGGAGRTSQELENTSLVNAEVPVPTTAPARDAESQQTHVQHPEEFVMVAGDDGPSTFDVIQYE